MEQIKTDALRDINRHHEESKEKREIENNRIQIKKEREALVRKQRIAVAVPTIIAATLAISSIAVGAHKNYVGSKILENEFKNAVSEECIDARQGSNGIYSCNDKNGIISPEDAAYRAYSAAKRAGMTDAEISVGQNGEYEGQFLTQYVEQLSEIDKKDQDRAKQLAYLSSQKEKLENSDSNEISRGGLR